ncbi:MAG TPA: nitrate/sulfonate/bicarbonate ABC transporter ATP-binding protein [Vicinamibacterales bacterium]|nr:nitrate/sulfonate/bicarbonate ABC transporter ATP-binding protein [Vicinamibacterales bacterium]
MSTGTPEEFRRLVSDGRMDHAIALLRWFEPPVAADAFAGLASPDQERLFRLLPVDLVVTLAENLPYYQTYVLLRKRSAEDVRAVIEAINPFARDQLHQDLSEANWRELVEPAAPPRAADRVIVDARGIEKLFRQPDGGSVQVIAPMDIALREGEIVAVLGPSGSGKSTLLRILSGLVSPTSGEVRWRGVPLAESTPRLGIVFQSFALFPWLTVAENVELPLKARGGVRIDVRTRALRTLEAVGLKGFEDAYPKELSGGMRQRVGFARALVVEPEVLFMDEPFSALDVLTAENLRGELTEIWTGRRTSTQSIFLVTHNIEEAVTLADRIVVLGRNPARIRADFNVPLQRPRDARAQEFVLYVDYVYKLMTQPEMESEPPSIAAGAARSYPVLPHAKRGEIGGFLELLNSRGHREDLYRVAGDLHLEVDDLLPTVEAARLLAFVTTEGGDVEITDAGRRFADADIAERTRLFNEAVLAHVWLLQHMHAVLTRKSDHTMPMEFFREGLQKHFSEEEVQRQLETALDWGRYAGVVAYDADTDRLSLPEPEPSALATVGDDTVR